MMKRILTALFLSISLLTLIGVSASAQVYQKGIAAYDRGDYATVFREWRTVANQGDSIAQLMLGLMYQDGTGATKDSGEAAKGYRKAAEQGNAWAQFNLGVMCNEGEGVPQDDAEAMPDT